LASQFDGILFSALGPIQGHKSSAFISSLGQIEKFFFSISALTPSVRLWRLISTFAPIGMLDLNLG
jgi:hypothetical protein